MNGTTTQAHSLQWARCNHLDILWYFDLWPLLDGKISGPQQTTVFHRWTIRSSYWEDIKFKQSALTTFAVRWEEWNLSCSCWKFPQYSGGLNSKSWNPFHWSTEQPRIPQAARKFMEFNLLVTIHPIYVHFWPVYLYQGLDLRLRLYRMRTTKVNSSRNTCKQHSSYFKISVPGSFSKLKRPMKRYRYYHHSDSNFLPLCLRMHTHARLSDPRK